MKLNPILAVSVTAFMTVVNALPGRPNFSGQEENNHQLTNSIENNNEAPTAFNIEMGHDTANSEWKDSTDEKYIHPDTISARDLDEIDYDAVIERARQDSPDGLMKRKVIETKGMTECPYQSFLGKCIYKTVAALKDDSEDTTLGCFNRDTTKNYLQGSMAPDRGLRCDIYFSRDCKGKAGLFQMVYPGSGTFGGNYWDDMGNTSGPQSYRCEYISFGFVASTVKSNTDGT